MFSFSKIKSWIFVGILCIVIITIYVAPVTADNDAKPTTKKIPEVNMPTTNKTMNNADSTDPSCISCPDTQPVCPTCPSGVKCVLSIRTCRTCPQASCDTKSSNNDGTPSNSGSNKGLLPGIIGGVLGAFVLIVACFGYAMFKRRKSRKNRGTRLEETTSMNSENVIPIAYIPPTTLKTPENTYQGINSSHLHETLIDLADEDASCEVGTILQATKTSPVTTTTNTATLVTATRVKPALVRINTLKSNNNSANSTRSGTPNSNSSDKTLLNTPASSVQGSPSIIVSDVPRIDIERSSGESSRPSTQATSSQHLNSPFVDPIEGRQSFGLFGSDEVYSTDPATPQLQRESTVSSNSTTGRSTMFSDEGDGEIMIFWGGSDTPGVVCTTSTPDQADERKISSEVGDLSKNTTSTKEEKI